MSNLEVTGVNGKNISVKDGDNTYVVYSNAGNATCSVGDILTVTGTICQYNTTAQIKAWKAADIEVVPPTGGGDQPGDDPTSGGQPGDDPTGGGQPGDDPTGGNITASNIVFTYPDDDTEASKVGSYTATWTAKKGDYTWTISNFNNNNGGWSFIKCGRKNNASVASITLDQAPSFAISKVVVTFDNVVADKINSSKLYVATNADFTEGVQEIPVTVSEAGDVDFVVTNPASNLYYKLEFDCASHTANGFVVISKITYKVL